MEAITVLFIPCNKVVCADRSGIAVCSKGKGEKQKKEKREKKWGRKKKATSRYEITSAIVLFFGLADILYKS